MKSSSNPPSPLSKDFNENPLFHTNSSATTFPVFDKIPQKLKIHNESRKSSIKLSQQYEDKNCLEIIQKSPTGSNSVASSHGFVRTVLQCYNNQCNLIIRPDDVWAAIVTQFSSYVKANSKIFQDDLEPLKLNKKLSIIVTTSTKASFKELNETFTETVKNRFKNSRLGNWILPNFSTTTAHDVISIGTILHSNRQQFPYYPDNQSIFGIPWITIEGNEEDWLKIYNRIEQTLPFGLTDWCDMLEQILKQFIQAKNGNVDLNFWKRVCNCDSGIAGSYVSGWITTFCIFECMENGNVRDSFWCYDKWLAIDSDKLPSGVRVLDVTIIEEDGTQSTCVMITGQIAMEMFDDRSVLKPNLGWAIAFKPNHESAEPNIKLL